MSIIKVSNAVVYVEKTDKWSSGKTGVFASGDFAISDNNDPLKQIQFDASGVAANTTITLAAPSVSGTIGVAGQETIQYAASTTGQTVTIAPATTALILEPAGTLSALTINFPAAVDGKAFSIGCTQIVTTLTLVGAGSDTIITQTAAFTAGQAVRYVARSTKWYLSV